MTEPQDPSGPDDPHDVHDPHDPHDPAPEAGHVGDVGSVGEEAAKLLGALSDWARDPGGDAGPGVGAGLGAGLSGLAGHAADAWHASDHQPAPGTAVCTWCPVCRTVHAVRSANPEVKAHLANAASSLLQAVAGVLATVPPPGAGGSAPGAPSHTASTDLQKIDLEGDDDD